MNRMLSSKKKIEKIIKPVGITIPAGTEQETGLTRAETELPPEIKMKRKQKNEIVRKSAI